MGHDIDTAAERAYTAAIRDHAARLIDGSDAYPFDLDDYCAVIELCDDHDAALDRLEAVEAELASHRDGARPFARHVSAGGS